MRTWNWRVWMQSWAGTHPVMLVMIGFLLGRAVILNGMSPFALAFFAVVYYVSKERVVPVGVAILLGSLTVELGQTIDLLLAGVLFFGLAQWLRSKWGGDVTYAPLLVMIALLVARVAEIVLLGSLSLPAVALVLLEAGFGLVLTLIFAQALPIFMIPREHRELRSEEFLCLAILAASLVLGTTDWTLAGLAAENVLSRYIILLIALVGGVTYGAVVGVTAGLVLSLSAQDTVYQISLLAFSGMLAGLMKEGGKPAVSAGLLLGSTIIAIYMDNGQLLLLSLAESLLAILLFVLTPKRLIAQLASLIPGTTEHLHSRQEYNRRVRDLTARRVEQFSHVFRELAGSFMQFTRELPTLQSESKKLISMIADKACVDCRQNHNCWSEQPYRSYLYVLDVIHEVEHQLGSTSVDSPYANGGFCVAPERVYESTVQALQWHHHDMHLRRQVRESRQLVAEQLSGVSHVMTDLANEIKREGRQHNDREAQIRLSLRELGLAVQQINVISLDEGNVRIDLILPADSRRDMSRILIAPLLSSILHEQIAVKQERLFQEKAGYSLVSFGSHKEFYTETGVAMVAKGGDWLSGDSYTTVDIGHGGKFAVAISDGMGNGERANLESRSALTILEQLLKSGMNETLAIKSVNSILNLRSSDDVYATVDVALIDLYSADTTFMKIGSMPSFIKRGESIIPISANNLPVGILQEIDVDLIRLQLQADDLLIMMTDGAFEASGYDAERERRMMAMIADIRVKDAQCFADMLLEKIMRTQKGRIADDMTIVVTRIERHHAPWAVLNWTDASGHEPVGERVVS